MQNIHGLIFDIQRFSIHDGTGIRTTVFFKGCSLRCVWCHNPESQALQPEVATFSNLCKNCGKCQEVCKKQTPECIACGECAKVCPTGARVLFGKNVTPDEVFDIVIKDKEYYLTSSGGITLSGGEPLLQADFAAEILKRCKETNVNTAIETAGNVPFSAFERVLPYTDLFLFDIKAIDPELHKCLTGVTNELILQNANKLVSNKANVLFRTPVVPEYNLKELDKIAAFVNGRNWELMAYHKSGIGKYNAFSREYQALSATVPTPDEMHELANKYGAIYSPSGV